MNEKRSPSFYSILSLITLALCSYAMLVRFYAFDFDDGYIVYRIVKNMLAGYGWTYNIGEAHNPSTSVLNTILIYLSSPDVSNISAAAHWITAISSFLSGIVTFLLFRKSFGGFASLIAGVSIIHLLGYSYTWGIESSLFVFLLLASVWRVSENKNPWAYLGAATLTRPDAVVLAGLVWLKNWYSKRDYSLSGVLIYLLVLLPWFIFSISKFGTLFPDTLSAKIWQGASGFWGAGPIYLKALLKHMWNGDSLPFAVYITAAFALIPLVKNSSSILYLVVFAALQQITYSILNVPGYHWYFIVVDATTVICALYLVFTLIKLLLEKLPSPRRNLKHSFSYAGLFVTAIFLYQDLNDARRDPVIDGRDSTYKKAVEVIEEIKPNLSSFATVEVGTIAYFLDAKVVDMTGLTSKNPEFISGDHNDEFFAAPPELVIMHMPPWHFEQALHADKRFRRLYRRAERMESGGIKLQFFVLK